MLYAAGVPDKEHMNTAPHVGIASVWWEGNPCNMTLLDMGKEVKRAVTEKGLLGWQYNTIGVSDAITMGHPGKRSRSVPRIQLQLAKLLRRYAVFTSIARDHCRLH
jgi:dihydroxyacid dehydratase/phosphogluconate dehydratase